VATVLDLRGLRCPLVLVKARAELARTEPREALVVLATDREAPIDLAALASDAGRPFSATRTAEGAWRCTLDSALAPDRS
jgi:tRNA 2-thiouridine synthesizing protein A